ncbi:MAG: NAD(P)-binding domain-containing protein [Candidatus Omnitrophota bacterium]
MSMNYEKTARELISRVTDTAKTKKKLSGFCIGNTAKIENNDLYFTPLREIHNMSIAGVIVYSEKQAIDIAREADGKVDYILVDAEKKIPECMSRLGTPANVERAVRETVKKSSLWVYKGNDLAVEALDGLLAYLTKDSLQGIGGKKIAIIGAGNLGCKLAIKLVERGAHIFITRRDAAKIKIIAKAINHIKPAYTIAKVIGMTDNLAACKGADILIGMTAGIPVITAEMIRSLAPGAIVVDGGKGTLYPEAIGAAYKSGIEVYRLDVSAAFEGLISHLFACENLVRKRMGRRVFRGEPIVSGGLMGRKGDIVVDNVHAPSMAYGIADGKGDFIRSLSQKHLARMKSIKVQEK